MTRFVALALAGSLLVGCQPPPPDIAEQEEGLSVCLGKSSLEGIDVSTYQGSINWAQVKASGRAFAITRVGDGLGGDNTFDTNWKGIKSVGMVRGAYQFFRPGKDPIAQADILLAKIGAPQDGDLPPTLDAEVTDGQSNATIAANMKKWLEHVKAKSGRTPMIYTSPGYWSSIGSPNLGGYVLWVAHWQAQCPTIPGGWSTFSAWQYSDSGTVPGISGAVDLDHFNGDQAALDKLASNPQTTPPDLGGAGGGGGGGAGGTDDGGVGDGGNGTGGAGGGGGGDGSGGIGGNGTDPGALPGGLNGGKPDQPGAGMAQATGGCSMARTTEEPPAYLLSLILLALLARHQLNRRDQKCRRGARGPA